MKEKLYNPHLFLTLASLFWGFNAIAGRLAVDEISPMLIVTGRWLGVMIILSIICRHQLSLGFQVFKSHYKWMVIMGLCGFTTFNSIYYISAHHTVAINLGIVQSTMPAFIMIISMFWLKTIINFKQVAGLLVTFVGVSIVISNGDLVSLLRLKLNNGDLLMIFACIFYAIYAVGLRKRPEINDILLMTIFSSIIMFNTKNFKSNSFKIVIGLFFSVTIYYITNFFNVMGSTEKIPITFAIWIPLIFLSIINVIMLTKINEK